jgi:serine/threonine protein phosphatase 1
MSDGTSRLIAIGDVHGCAHALETLLDAIVPVPSDTFVFLGDLIDQGHESADVLNRIIALQSQCRVVLIQGNHEEMLFAARENELALRYWEEAGGVYTLNSYRFGAGLAEIPPEHWALIASCRPYFEVDDFIMTHANYLPDVPMNEQPDYQLRWALFVPDDMRAHQSGKTVVVGHTEQRNSEIRDLGFVICLDTACWRHGWLSALELRTRTLWQASRWGLLREDEEPSHRGHIPQLQRQVTTPAAE